MAPARKKAQQQSLVDQFREAIESRIPADWRREAERQYKDLRKQFDKQFSESQKSLTALRKQVDQRLNRVAERGELDKLAKRIEGLQQDIERLARQTARAGAGRTTSTAATPSRTSSRRTAAAKAAAGTTSKTTAKRTPAAAKTPGASTTTRRASSTPAVKPARAPRRATPAAPQAPASPPENEAPPAEPAS
jgi:competence protein ComEA